MDGGAWWAAVHGVAKSQTQLSDFTFTFHFHALEKEMATHSSVLAWRIPGTAEPGGLPSMGVAESRTQLKRLSSSRDRRTDALRPGKSQQTQPEASTDPAAAQAHPQSLGAQQPGQDPQATQHSLMGASLFLSGKGTGWWEPPLFNPHNDRTNVPEKGLLRARGGQAVGSQDTEL